MLRQESDLGKLIAYQRVSELVDSEKVNPLAIQATARLIREDMERFEGLLGASRTQKGCAA